MEAKILTVSVIVPVYYGQKYIPEIIDQVEACCKYPGAEYKIELLFINDAPDAPLFQNRESEWIDIIIVNTDRNIGIQGARIKGLKRCKGEYVLFLDQDDKIEPEYLYSQLQAIGENDAVVCSAVQGGEKFYLEHLISGSILSRDLALTGWNPILSPGQVLMKRESVSNTWKENILKHNGADDWFLWLCMLSEGASFALNEEVLFEHVLTGENTSDDVIAMLESEQEIMSLVQEKRLFSDRDFNLLMQGFFRLNMRRIKDLDSFRQKVSILDKWIKLKENGIRYSDYLIGTGIRTVAIYGCGTLGEYLYADLKDDMDVRYYIDRNADKIRKEIPVYTPSDKLPKIDSVIITVVIDADKVAEMLERILCSRIFILQEWLFVDRKNKYLVPAAEQMQEVGKRNDLLGERG
ncbi:MAG: glycosyltransferase family 2 protein [Lachnospiraceae bacterium]|nr:glycosyltransferase family 2 protein [Lachnospiraceae bacterium]